MNDQPNPTALKIEQVRSALELLAADPREQLAYLERLGTSPSLDELALEFDDVRGLIEGLVSTGAVPAELKQVAGDIDASTEAMSNHADLWVPGAIDRPEWQSLRALGRKALELVPPSTR